MIASAHADDSGPFFPFMRHFACIFVAVTLAQRTQRGKLRSDDNSHQEY